MILDQSKFDRNVLRKTFTAEISDLRLDSSGRGIPGRTPPCFFDFTLGEGGQQRFVYTHADHSGGDVAHPTRS